MQINNDFLLNPGNKNKRAFSQHIQDRLPLQSGNLELGNFLLEGSSEVITEELLGTELPIATGTGAQCYPLVYINVAHTHSCLICFSISVNKHKPWIETSYHGVITENTDTVLLDPPLVALDKDAPVPYAGTDI